MTKAQAITRTTNKYPAMSVAVATYYVEEILGYYADQHYHDHRISWGHTLADMALKKRRSCDRRLKDINQIKCLEKGQNNVNIST